MKLALIQMKEKFIHHEQVEVTGYTKVGNDVEIPLPEKHNLPQVNDLCIIVLIDSDYSDYFFGTSDIGIWWQGNIQTLDGFQVLKFKYQRRIRKIET
jgi:hypothetical protein